jgi:hypothetical protein
MITSRAFTCAILLVNAAMFAAFYWTGILEVFLVAVGAIILPTLTALLWEHHNAALRRMVRLPIVGTLTFFAGCAAAALVLADLRPSLLVTAVALVLEFYLIWRVFLRRSPPGDWGGDGGGDYPAPRAPRPPAISEPLPVERSLAWRQKSHAQKNSVEFN